MCSKKYYGYVTTVTVSIPANANKEKNTWNRFCRVSQQIHSLDLFTLTKNKNWND